LSRSFKDEKNIIYSIINAIESVVSHREEFVPLHEPCFSGNEWAYVKDCLDTGWVSSVGSYVDRFELMLADFIGVKYAVAVVNGTAALHICLKLVGVAPGDEVLIPALTFVATANAVTYCNAIPHFVDSEERTLGIDPYKLRDYLYDIAIIRTDDCINKITGRRIKAVVPMHTFGHPVDMDPLLDVCSEFKLELVEDAAESLGSYYKGKHTGNFGKVSALSFNGNKIITTGGGGAILSNNKELAKLAKHITTTAKLPHRWLFYHDMVGYNYRMPNLNAALGCAQMENLNDFIYMKRCLAQNYKAAFSSINEVHFFTENNFSKSNYWLNALIIKRNSICKKEEILEALNDVGIMTRPAWMLLSELPIYGQCPKMDLSVAKNLQSFLINIPSSSKLGVKRG